MTLIGAQRLTYVCVAGLVACGHAAPAVIPKNVTLEQERRERIPDDHRTVDGTWDNVKMSVTYADGATHAVMTLRHPKFRYFYQPAPKDGSVKTGANPAATPGAQDVSKALPELLARIAAIDIERVDIHDGELEFIDMSKPDLPEIWLSELEVSIENAATKVHLAEGKPVLIAARAKIQRSGELAAFITADPWSDDLNFSGRASIEGLSTNELYSFLASNTKLQAPNGSMDLYVAFEAKGGQVLGGVKPILKGVQLRPVSGGLVARTRAWFADHVLSLFSDRVPGRRAVATVLPIEGKLSGPNPKLWPALTGVLYNAYSRGIAAGFGGVPTADAVTGTSGEQMASASQTPARHR